MSIPSKPALLEVTHTQATLAWRVHVLNGIIHELQMKAIAIDAAVDTVTEWTTLSSTLTKNTVKKKNLNAFYYYVFRVRCRQNSDDEWSQYSEESDKISVLNDNTQLMSEPTIVTMTGTSVTIAWEPITGCDSYTVRYRSDDNSCETDSNWKYIDSKITGTMMKKNNLSQSTTYYFAVMPNPFSFTNKEYAYSAAVTVTLPILSSPLQHLLPAKLFNTKLVHEKISENLAGCKNIFLYFSAKWCPPCRQYTPLVASYYENMKKRGKSLEVVFVSCDHSEEEFKEYYTGHHPWLAIPYDDDKREGLSSMYNITGIPRLILLNRDGSIKIDSVGQNLNESILN